VKKGRAAVYVWLRFAPVLYLSFFEHSPHMFVLMFLVLLPTVLSAIVYLI